MNNKWVRVVSVLMAAAATWGCSTIVLPAGQGKGAVVESAGVVRSTQEASYETTVAAAKAVLADLGFAVTDEQTRSGTLKLTARGAQDRKLVTEITSVSDKLTGIEISGGSSLGSTTRLLILEKVRDRLAQ
jgi:hypothetical protein